MEINILGTIEPITVSDGLITNLWNPIGDDYYKDKIVYLHELDYHKRSAVEYMSPPDDLREWMTVLR